MLFASCFYIVAALIPPFFCPTSASSIFDTRLCNAFPPSSAEIAADLRPFLSKGAEIVLPSDEAEWARLTSRSSWPRVNPGYLAIVEVATEQDVQGVIHYANIKSLPFLAVSTGHGWTTSTNNLQNGIQISMRKLQSVEVNADGKTATIGGGATQNTTLKYLAEVGKRAVTGLCECTSVIGPALGGGHSMLQGQHGFAADNMISARLVLSNATAVTVSAESFPDLFWAIRGAGHNFGIVTSFQTKIYPIPAHEAGLWTLSILTFAASALELFFGAWNALEVDLSDPQSILLLHGMFNRNPVIDPTNNPMITLVIAHEGANHDSADKYISTFRSLSGLTSFHQESQIPWSLIHDKMGLGAPPVCQTNVNFVTVPSPSLSTWNVTNLRQCWELYEAFTQEREFLGGSFWLMESYGRGKAKDLSMVRENAVAREERLHHLLPALTLFWDGNGEQEREVAEDVGRRARELMREGVAGEGAPATPHMYVNYAVGHREEKIEEMYGWDEERLRKLQILKRKYDPENRFRFNAPLM